MYRLGLITILLFFLIGLAFKSIGSGLNVMHCKLKIVRATGPYEQHREEIALANSLLRCNKDEILDKFGTPAKSREIQEGSLGTEELLYVKPEMAVKIRSGRCISVSLTFDDEWKSTYSCVLPDAWLI